MSLLEKRPIHRGRNLSYEMSLTIYCTALCGDDLQKGSPVRVSARGEDLYELKRRTAELILSVVLCEGECFVEMMITENGKYVDRDEWWCTVDTVNKKVKEGKYES